MRSLILTLTFFALSSVGAAAQQFEKHTDKLPSLSLVENFGTETLGATEAQKARKLTEISLDLIKHFEGWVPYAYNDSVGYCTIGYGHLIALKSCEEIELGRFSDPLTESEGEQLLLEDTIKTRLAVSKLVKVDLEDYEYGALVSFAFNVGAANLAKSRLLKLTNDNQKEYAAKQFPRWVKAKGIVFAGLVARRACEQTLFLGRLSYDKSGEFSRSNCDSLGAAQDVGTLIDMTTGED